MNSVSTLVCLLLLFLLSAFFSGAEIAYMSLSHVRLRYLVETNVRKAKLVASLRSRPHQLLITILIGNNLANVGASSFATAAAIELLESMEIANSVSYGVGIATGVITFLLLLFGEIWPKSFCISHAERMALLFAPLILFFQWVFFPFLAFFGWLTRGASEKYVKTNYPTVTEDEVRTMVTMSNEVGGIKEEEKEMIENVFEFDNTQVKQVITPRVDMFSIPTTLSIGQAFEQIKGEPFSRIPVFEERRDNIVGIVHAKDIMLAVTRGENDAITRLMRKPIYVPETMMIDAMLREFKEKNTHIAMVFNEHGGVEGLVTIEDLLERIVGEIYDETDVSTPLIRRLDERRFRVAARLGLTELKEEFEINIPQESSYDTLSGFLLYEFGHIPSTGERIELPEAVFTVESVGANRIKEVMIELKGKIPNTE